MEEKIRAGSVISTFFAEDRVNNHSVKLGRQRTSKGGVIGRFDGAELSTQVTSIATLNLVMGYPVDRPNDDFINTDRHFFGANIDFGTYNDSLDFNLFVIEHRLEDLVDRRALGGEFRYFKQNYNLFGLLDYDIHFAELNAALLNGYYLFESGTTANLSLNYRKSPYLTTRNALIGQQVDSITDITETFTSADEITELALDRTFDSQYTSLNLSHPLNKTFDINGTITVSSLSGAPASGGVAAVNGTGSEYYFSSQLVGKGLFSTYDTTLLGVTYGNLSTSKLYSANAQLRYPLSDLWRLYPKFAIQMRKYDDSRNQMILKPVFRAKYDYRKSHSFDFEIGASLYDTENRFDGSDTFQIFFVNLGYYYNF